MFYSVAGDLHMCQAMRHGLVQRNLSFLAGTRCLFMPGVKKIYACQIEVLIAAVQIELAVAFC